MARPINGEDTFSDEVDGALRKFLILVPAIDVD